MLAKMIAYAPSREQAIATALRGLNEYFIGGIKTNVTLFRRILTHKDFVTGNIDTGFLDRLLATTFATKATDGDLMKIAAIGAAAFEAAKANAVAAPALHLSQEQKKESNGAAQSSQSGWRRTARREGLEGL